jgi:hypothetical protein
MEFEDLTVMITFWCRDRPTLDLSNAVPLASPQRSKRPLIYDA